MKQSYAYKSIFLWIFLFSTTVFNAFSFNNGKVARFFSYLGVDTFSFAVCQPIFTAVEGEILVASVPYYSGSMASCENGAAIEFVPKEDSVYFAITESAVSYLYASLYKKENGETQYVRNYRMGKGGHLIDDLQKNATYQLVLYQNIQSQVADVNCQMMYSEPVTAQNGPYVQVSNTEYTIAELVTDVLIENDCVQVSNITWASGTGTNQSIAYFNGNNSVFPFQDGVILSTGRATSANGPKANSNQSVNNALGTDQDLANILNISSALLSNATKLEFDFVPISDQISFNFIFASEEYGAFQCNYSDVFAFILTNLSTGAVTNLAVVPNTNTPISVTTIRDNQYNNSCESVNEQYFANYYQLGDANAPINFKGHTVSLTASSAVTPGNTYHIKLVIADYLDSLYDSAVFIEGGSFDIGSIDLGNDLLTSENSALCADEEYLLESGVNPEYFSIQWYLNDQAIPGATNPNYTATTEGMYKIEAQFVGTDCMITDEILIEMYPRLKEILFQPQNIEICNDYTGTVDLTSVEAGVLGSNSATEFYFKYYKSLADLENQTNEITSPQTYNPQESQHIYMKMISADTECEDYYEFDIIRKPEVVATKFEDLTICNTYSIPQVHTDEKIYSGSNQSGTMYNPGEILGAGEHTLYVFRTTNGCTNESSYKVTVINCDLPKGISPNNDGLNDFLDLTYYGVKEIRIYNRYGKEVYRHGEGYTTEWKGQDNQGNQLPDGTYFYSIKTVLDRFEGWIQLNR